MEIKGGSKVINHRIYKSTRHVGILLGLYVLLWPAVLMAQQYYDPGILQRNINRTPVEYQAPGVRVGSFLLKPVVDLAWEHNDNIFYLPNLEISDNIFHVRPYFTLDSDWSRHALNLQAYADFARYQDFDSQDFNDWLVQLDGRFDFKRGSAFNYKADYMHLHEDRSNSTAARGVEPTIVKFKGFDVSYYHTFNRLKASVGYRPQDIDYDNSFTLTGDIVDNQDRDRSQDVLTARLDYSYSELSQIFVAYNGNKRDYDQKFDNGGYERSSDGYNIRLGAAWEMSGLLNGDLYLQYQKQNYDDPRLPDIDGFGIGADLEWTPNDRTSVSFNFANTVQESVLDGVSGYNSKLYSARLQYELRRNLLGNARISYTNNDYENNSATEDLSNTKVTRANIGLSYLFNRYFSLNAGYLYQKQTADRSSPDFEYRANRFFITLLIER
jgi:hypothetical protein